MSTQASPSPSSLTAGAAKPGAAGLRLAGAPGETLPASPAWIAMGFRPFFLLAALGAIALITLWLHALWTGGNPSQGLLTPYDWHAHEMLFGFAMAVIAGFLLTAARNWTGLNTLHGYPLLALALLWVAGRVAMAGALGDSPWLTAALVVGFQLALLAAVGHVLLRARSRRNYGIFAMLAVWVLAAMVVHAQALGALPGAARPALFAALHVVILLIVVMGGRVVPMFTRNATGVATIAGRPLADRWATGLAIAVAATAVLWAALPNAAWLQGTPARAVLGAVCLASAVAQAFRMRTWGVRAAMRVPLVAILHGGFVWLAVGHALLGVAIIAPTLMAASVALHALTIGCLGTITLGMMARVTLGHSGRSLHVGALGVVAFVAINLAVCARLTALIVPARHWRTTWAVAAALFALAFALYLVANAKALLTRRADGKPG